jgi:branched-chain amino acid transport system substrate-binding protein
MRRWFFVAASSAAVLTMAGAAQAQDVKIGFILPMTGQQQSTGKQEAAAAKLYMTQHGDTVAGKKVEKKNGELYNVEFATFGNVKDPIKAAEAK